MAQPWRVLFRHHLRLSRLSICFGYPRSLYVPGHVQWDARRTYLKARNPGAAATKHPHLPAPSSQWQV